MKKIGHRSVRLALAVGFVLTGWPAARGEGIPIVNAGFEDPAVKAGVLTTNGIPGWITPSLAPPPVPGAFQVAGVAALPPSDFDRPTDGSQVGYLFIGPQSGQTGVFQNVGVALKASTTYTLSIDFYTSKTLCCKALAPLLQLRAGQDIIASAIIIYGQTTTLSYSTSANDPNLGQPIGIYITESSADSSGFPLLFFFDHVRLDATTPLPVLHGAFCCGGISVQQTSRLSAFCDGSVRPAPCNATLEFHDSHGVLLSQSHVNLRPGESGFLDFPSTARAREPMEVIPKWFLNEGSASFSLETFDSQDLRTRLFTNWADGSVAKAGNLDSGPVSLTRGDTGRLKVYCDGSVRVEDTLRIAPCQADLSFLDGTGRVLKQSQMTLAPGTAGFLDLSFDEARPTDRRAVVLPALTVTGGPAVGVFAIIDSATGTTTTQAYLSAVQSVER